MMAHYAPRDKDPRFHEDDCVAGPIEGDAAV